MTPNPEGCSVDLSGRTALVTGGGRGIGRAIAIALARKGADVAVAARTVQQTTSVASEILALGRRGVPLTADVTSPQDVSLMAVAALDQLGSIDILVNSAGDAESAALARTDLTLWRRMLAVNLDSVFLCTSMLLPQMIESGWGRVINIASRAGLTGHAYVSAYCAAKHGVIGFTRAVALEVAGKGVTVNALCPGYVDTELTQRSARKIAQMTGSTQEEALARLAGFNPTPGLIPPEAVAEAALLLIAPESDFRNGEAVEL